MFNSKEAGQRIRKRREELNLSLTEFAEILGVSTGFIRNIEQGTRFVITDKLITISNLLNVSTDYILKGTEKVPGLGTPQDKLQYLIKNVKSEDEADFYIKLAFTLKRDNCGPQDFDNIYGVISAFTSYAKGRKQLR